MAIGRILPTWIDWSTRQQGPWSLVNANRGLQCWLGCPDCSYSGDSFHVSMVSVDAPADMLWVRNCHSNTRMQVHGFPTKKAWCHQGIAWWHGNARWLCVMLLEHHIVMCQWHGWCQEKRGIKRDECKDLGWLVYLGSCWIVDLFNWGIVQFGLVLGSKFRFWGCMGLVQQC